MFLLAKKAFLYQCKFLFDLLWPVLAVHYWVLRFKSCFDCYSRLLSQGHTPVLNLIESPELNRISIALF